MKKYILLFIFGMLAINPVLANCGAIPSQPTLLQENQVNNQQLELIGDQLENFIQNIQTYQDCIDSSVIALDPETQTYQTVFDDWMRLMDASQEQKMMAIDRFNFHVENVNDDITAE